MYMGLWDQNPPELLRWELHIKKRLIVDFVWTCLHGFDLWYWWFGLWKMKQVPVPQDLPQKNQSGNRVFFPYIGGVDLFDWISIPARIFNAYMLSFLVLDIFFVSVYSIQQRNLDDSIKPAKLKELVAQWLQTLQHPFRIPRLDPPPVSHPADTEKPSMAQESERLSANHQLRHLSTSSVISESSANSKSHSSIRSKQQSPVEQSPPAPKGKAKDDCFDQVKEEIAPPLYRRPTRTGTDLLKRSLMRWSTNSEPHHSTPPPSYTPYEPTFQNLYAASNLLTSSAVSHRHPNCFHHLKRDVHLFVAIFKLIPTLCTHQWRPSVLLAVLSYARYLGRNRGATYPEIVRLALRNPDFKTTTSKDVALASRFLLTLHPPSPPTRGMRLALGWTTFSVCSVLVIGTELTIQWNYISGVQNIESVGQLIPFCLGVGGLLKVIWAAVMEQERREEDRWCYFGRCNAGDRRAVWKEASEGFQKCINAYERESIAVPILTDDRKAGV
jgi:hypothetical protein